MKMIFSKLFLMRMSKDNFFAKKLINFTENLINFTEHLKKFNPVVLVGIDFSHS